MPKFQVFIPEHWTREVLVEAESAEKAVQEVLSGLDLIVSRIRPKRIGPLYSRLRGGWAEDPETWTVQQVEKA